MWAKHIEKLEVGAMLVRITGTLHGALFVWLCFQLWRALAVRQWPISRLICWTPPRR